LEIELPDGTVLDAPDGADVKKVVRGYRQRQIVAKNPEQYQKYQPETSAGVAAFSGAKRVDQGVGNLFKKALANYPGGEALGNLLPDRYSDEGLKETDAIDAPLKENHPIARAGGEMAAALPMAMAAAPLSSAATGSSMLTRTLGHPTSRAALEGLLPGAATAEVGEQGEGALKGAMLSGTMNALMKGGGRLVDGLIKKSDSAKALQQLAGQQGEDIFLPVSQAAGDQDLITKAGKVAYQEGLSLVPGVRGQLTRQSDEALEKVRELALKEATPAGVRLPGRPGNDVAESMASIRSGIEDAYDDTIRSVDFKLPGNLRTRLESAMRTANKDVDDVTVGKTLESVRDLITRFSDNGTIKGSNFLILKRELEKLGGKAKDFEQGSFKAVSSVFDDIIEKKLGRQGKLARYQDLEEPVRHFTGLEKATKAAVSDSGRFSPAQLARNAVDDTQRDLGQLSNEVLSESAAGTSFAGRNLVGGAGLLGVGAVGGPAAAAGVLVGGNLLATKTVQKALLGDTTAQRKIVEMMEKHPESIEAIQRAIQTAAATQGGN
jgi:hypothetical protein